jgi:chemotaxis protein MotA
LDVATLGGLIGGAVLILLGIITGGGQVGGFVSIPSFLIVLGGSFMSAMIAFPMDRVIGAMSLMGRTIRTESSDPAPLITLLVSLTRKARREGLLALDSEMEHIPSDFLRRGLRLVVDGSDPQVLREILENDIRIMQDRHGSGRKVLEYLGKVCPAFGMLGTLIGLVIMLYQLQSNPDGLGQAMAVALITTMYGVMFANLVFIPMANKLSVRSEGETLARYMMLEGITSIQSGENPSVLEERLKIFLPPSRRDDVEEGGGGEEE